MIKKSLLLLTLSLLSFGSAYAAISSVECPSEITCSSNDVSSCTTIGGNGLWSMTGRPNSFKAGTYQLTQVWASPYWPECIYGSGITTRHFVYSAKISLGIAKLIAYHAPGNLWWNNKVCGNGNSPYGSALAARCPLIIVYGTNS